jgi:hypothetical protein
MDCKNEHNKNNCNCSYPCSKKGICCECIESHRLKGELPACYFPDDVEETYDRRIERFIEVYQQRGPWWN